jgi:hypothetical protein
MMNSSVRTLLALAAVLLLGTSVAFAQATRTWISGVGDDENPCSRTAPCLTFAGAIDKTAAGGEISVLDPGDYGSVTITKSITLNGAGKAAGILVSCLNGITIDAGPADIVKLLHLQIDGFGTAAVGIQFNSGAALIVDDVFVQGFASGIEVYAGKTTVGDSLITQSSSIGVNVRGGALALENTILTANNVAAQATGSGTLRLSNTSLYNNLSGLGCGGGGLLTAGNNRKAGNSGGVVPICAPTGRVTVY